MKSTSTISFFLENELLFFAIKYPKGGGIYNFCFFSEHKMDDMWERKQRTGKMSACGFDWVCNFRNLATNVEFMVYGLVICQMLPSIFLG